MNLTVKIAECQTVAELVSLENMYALNDYEKGLVLGRKAEIITRLVEWRIENERLGLAANLMDSWTPEQRHRFLLDWQSDEHLFAASQLHDSTCDWPPGETERFFRDWQDDEPLLQVGRGEKRTHDEINDGAGTSTVKEVSDSNYFTMKNVKQIRVKKFRTTGVDYTVQFTDTFASLEFSQYHHRLHEISERLLNEIFTRDIPEQDQIRFVLQSSQLEKPISIPVMPLHQLTTERVLAQIERVIQSNHEFRLNDSVNVNLIHVDMPNGGTGTKRSEINLEKHLIKKGSIVRIENKDDICLARSLVVSIAKIENDTRNRQIRNHSRPLQARLANELHQKAGVPIGKCSLEEVKKFQTLLSDYQINIVSKEHQISFASKPRN